MTDYSNLEQRVRQLEGRHGIDPVILHFPNGSTRAIHVREPLPLLLAAFSLLNYFENDRFENPDGPFPDVSTRRQELVKLIGQASRIETDDNFFHLIHGFCVHACAFERCQTEAEVEELEVQLKPQKKPLLPE